jgi:hypothetical protein
MGKIIGKENAADTTLRIENRTYGSDVNDARESDSADEGHLQKA